MLMHETLPQQVCRGVLLAAECIVRGRHVGSNAGRAQAEQRSRLGREGSFSGAARRNYGYRREGWHRAGALRRQVSRAAMERTRAVGGRRIS